MPEGFSFEEAPGDEASHYALTNIRAARGGSGQDWLVYGATGAIGSSAVQLAGSAWLIRPWATWVPAG
jgi:NADPH:quinone reductase-like Zn-dependent oxidoreductase